MRKCLCGAGESSAREKGGALSDPASSRDESITCGKSTGFLHPRHSVLDINLKSGTGAAPSSKDALAVLEERYRLLQELDRAMAPSRGGRDRSFGTFGDFQSSA